MRSRHAFPGIVAFVVFWVVILAISAYVDIGPWEMVP